MCGIVGGLGKADGRGLRALRHRGPDAESTWEGSAFWVGHTRLSIIDPTARSDQPFRRGEVVLVYNGELWNFRALRAELEVLGERFVTSGDTEVVAAALGRWGLDALPKLQGMFGMAWTTDGGETLHLARDRFGEVPLHAFVGVPFAFASELKALRAMELNPAGFEWVMPGEVWTVSKRGFLRKRWYEPRVVQGLELGREEAQRRVLAAVEAGSVERTISDVPVCTLLSGGVDSAAVAAHLVKRLPGLVGYVAVMDPKSPDVKAAREVAEHLSMELREVRIPAPTAEDLAGVVESIEQPHKAQVEIGWACTVLARAMRSDGFKVTFSGEGSDELWASYGMSFHGIQKEGWYAYRHALFLGQHRKNFARCNKVFMREGIECRLPFLNTELVELALSLPQSVVQDGKSRPKAVLQEAHAGMLPERVVKRAKLAFQDGLGLKEVCAGVVREPERFYRGQFSNVYGGARV